MMFQKIAFCLVLSLVSLSLLSQEDYTRQEPEESFVDRLSFGGGMAAQFGTETFVFLAPQVLYKVSPKFYSGLGASYTFYSSRILNYSFSFYGGSVLSRYYLFDALFVQGEIEALRGKWDYTSPIPFNIYNILGGLGYSQNLGGAFQANIMLLYNFNQGPYSPYRNPIFRLGFNVGL